MNYWVVVGACAVGGGISGRGISPAGMPGGGIKGGGIGIPGMPGGIPGGGLIPDNHKNNVYTIEKIMNAIY